MSFNWGALISRDLTYGDGQTFSVQVTDSAPL